MKMVMTTDVLRLTEVAVASTWTDVAPDLLDREVTGGLSVRDAGPLGTLTTGEFVDDTTATRKDESALASEHEDFATDIEVSFS